MRKKSLAPRLSIGFFILMLALVFTYTGFAQEEGEPQIFQIIEVQVKPGMDLEFETFFRNLLPTLKEMGMPQLGVFKTANFGVSGKYWFILPLQDPAEMDAELSAPRDNIPAFRVSLMSAMQRMADSSSSFMLIPQPDLNISPEEGYEAKLLVNITVGVAPGREEDFRKALRETLAVVGKTNIKGALVGKVNLGGNLNDYIVTTLYDSFSQTLGNGPLIEKEMAAAEITPMTGIVYYMSSEVMVRIPELSFGPEQ